MKPIFLSIQAFGAFHTKQVIDFQKFDSLFLIHGATGAGKTTIFDAMCFALYGETTGGRKNMRSDYADDATETEVEFLFKIGMQAHRVIRRLRITGRVEKSVTEKQTYEQGTWFNGIFTPDAEPLTKKTDIKEKIEHVLGFTEAQFKQIIILPQGNFQEFLRSKHAEKTEVLQKLFSADIYRQIREKLEERGKAYQKKQEELETKIQTILQANKLKDLPEAEAIIAEFEQLIHTMEAEMPAMKKERDGAQHALKEAQALDKVFVELADAEQKLAYHNKQQEEITTIQERLKRNENAEPFQGDLAKLRELEAQRESYEANIRNQSSIILRIEKKIAEVQQVLDKNQDVWEEIIERNKLEINGLERIKPKFEEMSAKEKALADIAQKLLACEQERTAFEQKIEAQTEEKSRLQEQIEGAAAGRQDKGRLEQLWAQLKEKNLAYQKRAKVLEQYKTLEITVKNASEEEQKLANKARIQRDFCHSLERQWIDSQAFVLAETLQAGKPCPVCGSTHHPQRAIPTQTAVTEVQIQAERQQYEALERQYEGAREQRIAHEKRLAEVLAVGKSLREVLGDLATLSPADIQARLADAEANFLQAQRAELEATLLQQLLAKVSQEIADLEARLRASEGKIHELKTAKAVQENLIRALKAGIPAGIRHEQELNERILKFRDELEDTLDLLHKNQEDLRAETDKMNKAKHTIEEDEKHLHGNRLQNRKGILDSIRDLEKNIERNLAKYGFVEVREVLEASLKDEEKQQFKRKVDTFNTEKAKLQALMEEKRRKIGAQAKPDLATFEANVKRVEAAYMAQNKQLTENIEAYKHKSKQRDEIKKMRQALDDLMEAHKGLPELVNVARGTNPLRLNFETFVLSVFLDEVLYYANQRLELLSSGRYQLERKEDTSDGRKMAGMELHIFDQYTGTTRPVENLSGGETFFTSLALALGLADTAVAQAGGRSLDAMFIDEGFGTLDTETLDLAIKTLHSLSDEKRLVGIISHVAELKERIPAKLEVRKMKNGSVIR